LGEYFLSPGISREVINTYLKSHDKKSDCPGYDLLSEREKQIFRLTVEGNSINQAAKILFISPKTIERHRANIMKKLEVNNVVEMVKYAVKFGIVDPDLWIK
jgi:DNA-binding CsgD family transcriptional regulator